MARMEGLGDLYFGGKKKQHQPILENVKLGTDSCGRRVATQLDLRHPLQSCYNFYTWAEQISDYQRHYLRWHCNLARREDQNYEPSR
jgi:hypothetical protein